MTGRIRTLALAGALFSSSACGAKLIASHFSGNLYSLTLSDSGELTVDSETSSGNFWPAWLDLDTESRTLYVPDESDWAPPNGLVTFTVGEDGSLTPGDDGQTVTQGGEVHSTLYGGQDGKGFIAFAHYGSSKVTTFQLPLTSNSQVLQTFDFSSIPTGPHDRQDASHPHGVHLDPSGGYILAPDLGGDVVHIFAIDQETGSLTECDAAATEPGDGPRHAAYWTVSDGGNAELVFTVNELANTVTAWDVSYPEEEGGCLSLSPLQTLSTLPEGVDPPEGSKAAEIRVRDNFVYVSNRYDRSFGDEQDSLATFEIVLPINGTLELTFVELTNSESYFPRTFQINAEGNLVAVGGQTSSNVVILERNVENGRLGDVVAQVQVGDVGTPLEEDGLSAVIWVE